MQITDEIGAALDRAAQRYGVAPAALHAACAVESADALAVALGLPLAEARVRMERVTRIVQAGGDWGAGCKLLTDEITAELIQAIEHL